MINFLLSLLFCVVPAIPEKVVLHDITQISIADTESFVITPSFSETYVFSVDKEKIVLLHPVQKGNYSFILFSYNETTKKIDVVVTPFEVVGESPEPEPEPEPEPNPTPITSIKEKVKQGFIDTINDDLIAQQIVSTIDGVIVLHKQGKIVSPAGFRETVRYNLKLRLGNKYKMVDEKFDEPIIVPLLSQLDKEGKLKTIDDYVNVFSQIRDGLLEVTKK